MARRDRDFQTVRSEGGLLPADLLRRVLDPKSKLAGARPEDYGLPQSERLNEVITQSWNRLRKHWAEFQTAAANLPEGEAGTGLTNDKWTLPLLRELGFGLLPTSAGPEVNGRAYAISRFFGPVAVHLVGCGLSLDRRAAGQRGAAAANPHGLVQEFLNRSAGHLWAIVSNGLRLRVLRDNQALSRQSFLEFDLEAMFQGEVYSDFVLLWLMTHATRFAPREGARPETCWLEQWTKEAEEQGTRALEGLRGGVEKALEIIGGGFTAHPKNAALSNALRSGTVTLTDFHGKLLRIVYRLIFLFVAEDRTLEGLPLLHPRDDTDEGRIARERYGAHYSTRRLRELAGSIKGSRHTDLWRQLQITVRALSGDASAAGTRERLALPVLGSLLWDPNSTAGLNDAELTNYDLLEALRHLAFTRQEKALRPVDYRNLGAEELGGVYESLLALTPQISGDGARFTFAEFAGNERKTSGSYYTPDSLVQCLLDSALDPVVEEAIRGKTGVDTERAILGLKVCDPAVGSGHFLVGAAHRLARHLSRVRAQAQGESEPSPLLYQHALRDVIGRCLYGVDVNPMAAELCRVSLWLEALEPGKPLSFLDHHIRVGNSLLGTTPELIASGLPDEAFSPIEGDDKKACTELKKRNRAESKGLGSLFVVEDAERAEALRSAARAVDEMDDDTPERLARKAESFAKAQKRYDYVAAKRLADAWCAAFVIRKHFPPLAHNPQFTDTKPFGISQAHLGDLAQGRALASELAAEVERLAHHYQFFHWQLAFPEVFGQGGFDCVLGNPPWDQIQLDPREYFAASAPEIAQQQKTHDRDALIKTLQEDRPSLYIRYISDQRTNDGTKSLIHGSTSFPLTSKGRLNSGPLFAELAANIIKTVGRLGMLLPSGIATDSFTQAFFSSLVSARRLISFYEFENVGFFEGAGSGHMVRFALTTVSGPDSKVPGARFMFHGTDLSELSSDTRVFSLSDDDVLLLNPNTGTCPIFWTKGDAELTKGLYRRHSILARAAAGKGASAWGFESQLMFMTNTSSRLLHSAGELAGLGATKTEYGCYELGSDVYLRYFQAKMVHQFNHRHGDFGLLGADEKGHVLPRPSDASLLDPQYTCSSKYYVRKTEVLERLDGKWAQDWLIGWRDISDARASARTVISAAIPLSAVDSQFILAFVAPALVPVSTTLPAIFNSYAFDYLARQKIGGTHLRDFIMKQLPVLGPERLSEDTAVWSHGVLRFLLIRTLELTYTAWDLEPFANDCGWDGPPFRWDEERRFFIRCELDAAFFHLYLPTEADGHWRIARKEDGCPHDETPEELAALNRHFPTPRDAVAYILDTFPIVRRKDEGKYNGDYRTKRVILEIYDAMQEAIRTRQPYQTRLDPPPGSSVWPLPDWPLGTPRPANWPPHIHSPHRTVKLTSAGASESDLRAIEQELQMLLDDESVRLLEQIRAHGLLTGEEWDRVKGYLRNALHFLSNPNQTVTRHGDGKLQIDPDADPRNADWLRVAAANRLAGHILPAWAALWLWWLRTDSSAAFWRRVGEIADELGFQTYEAGD